MKKRIVILLFTIILLTACGTPPFEKHMRDGKDAMKTENYSEAIDHFKLALIESPSDEDAQILYNLANQMLEIELNK